MTVYDAHGNARPPYNGPPVRPVVNVPCWACAGTGWHEHGLQEFTNIGRGNRCVHCAGTGRIAKESTHE